LAVAPSPTGADGAAAESSDALVLDLPSYAIQLIAFRDKERMLGYVEERGLADRALYGLSSSGGSRWYVVVQGFYPSRPAAQAAAEELPEALKRLEPWIKQFPAGSRFERFDRGGARSRADASTGRP
jgi:septal ring-binding cell division protein DamX